MLAAITNSTQFIVCDSTSGIFPEIYCYRVHKIKDKAIHTQCGHMCLRVDYNSHGWLTISQMWDILYQSTVE